MKKRITCIVLCLCMAIGLLPKTSLMPGGTLVTNAAAVATTTEFINGREVIRITNDSPKDNPYGIGTYGTSSLKLFLNILRNNPDAYIIMETDINVRNNFV